MSREPQSWLSVHTNSALMDDSSDFLTSETQRDLEMSGAQISSASPGEAEGCVISNESEIESTGKKTYKIESITLNVADEARIEAAVINANKKQTTGSVFSVRIDIKKSAGVLAIGVKDLNQGVLAVSMLKRRDGEKGPGEEAGLRLGDVIFGVNFTPTRDGSRTLLNRVKSMTESNGNYIHMQCWRCHQLCSDSIPGSQFPRSGDVIIKAFSLYRTKVLSDWERWNFVQLILEHMIQDLRERYLIKENTAFDKKIGPRLSSKKSENVKQLKITDLERNIQLAKCLRSALCARIVHTKPQSNMDAVVYVLRVEDIETGLQWVVHRRYRDFYALNEELLEISSYTKDMEFPKKRLTLNSSEKVVESRMMLLEQFIRKVLYLFNLHATTDHLASKSLRHVQRFLGVDKYIDCMHPPAVDDQRYIELLAYHFLNDFGSPACQQCVRFVNTVELDKLVKEGSDGYRPVLQHLNQALSEVEQFTLQQHQNQMVLELKERRPEMNPDQLATFVRRCVRRQVEAALFLPLRRTIIRIVFSFIAPTVQENQEALKKLMTSDTDHFMVDSFASSALSLPIAIRKLNDVTNAYLPADQGQLLMHAASSVMELHTECMMNMRSLKLTDNPNTDDDISEEEKNTTLDTVESENESKFKIVETADDYDYTTENSERTDGIWEQTHGKNMFLGKTEQRGDDKSGLLSSEDIQGISTSASSSRPNRRWSVATGGSVEDSVKKEKDVATTEDKIDEIEMKSANRRLSVPSDFQNERKQSSRSSDLDFMSRDRPSITNRSLNGESVACSNIDLKSSVTFADPVKIIFESRETVPAIELYRDVTYITDSDLSFLESDREFESVPYTDFEEEDSSSVSSSNNEAAPLSTTPIINRNEGVSGVFSPSLDTAVRIANLQQPKRNFIPLDIEPSVSGEAKHGALKLRASSFSPLDDDESGSNKSSITGDNSEQGENEKVFRLLTERDHRDSTLSEVTNTSGFYDNSHLTAAAVSADDFLPMFTYVIAKAALPHLVLVKEIMAALVDDEESYGECGYYLATLEASLTHITDMANEMNH